MRRGTKRNDYLVVLLKAHMQKQANPDRVGCMALQDLEAWLGGKLKQQTEGVIQEHVLHCRECWLELKTLRDIKREAQQEEKRRMQEELAA